MLRNVPMRAIPAAVKKPSTWGSVARTPWKDLPETLCALNQCAFSGQQRCPRTLTTGEEANSRSCQNYYSLANSPLLSPLNTADSSSAPMGSQTVWRRRQGEGNAFLQWSWSRERPDLAIPLFRNPMPRPSIGGCPGVRLNIHRAPSDFKAMI